MSSLPGNRSALFVALVALVNLSTRVWIAFTFPVEQVSDYGSYFQNALVLAGQLDLPIDRTWTPGQSLLLAPLFYLFGPQLPLIGIVNAVLHTGCLFCTWAATRRLFSQAAANCTALVMVLSFSDLLYNDILCTEIPAGLLLSAMVLLSTYRRRRGLLLLGVLAGIGTYFRSELFFVGGLLAVLATRMDGGGWVRVGRRAAFTQAMAVLVVIPLCFFYEPAGRFTPFSPKLGRNLWQSNNPYLRDDPFHGIYGWHQVVPLPEYFPPGSRERQELLEAFRDFYVNPEEGPERRSLYAWDGLHLRYATAWIRAHPRTYLRLVAARGVFLFADCNYATAYYRPDAHWRADPGRPYLARLVERFRLFAERWYQYLMAGVLLVLGVETVRTRGRWLRTHRALPLWVVVFLSIPFLLIHALNRYHVPMLPLLWVYLGHGMEALRSRIRGRVLTRKGS